MNQLSNFFAIVVAVGVVACLAYDLKRSLYRLFSGRSVVLVAVAYWYLLEALRVPKALEEYTQGEYSYGLFCVSLSVAVFLAAYHGSHWALFNPLARRLPILDDSRVLWRLMLAGFAIGFGSLLIYVDFDLSAFFDGLSGLNRRWSSSLGRGRYGSWRTIFYELQMFLQATIPLAVCMAFQRRAPLTQRWVAALFVIWLFFRTLSSGSRTPLVPIVVCVAVALFWRAGPRLRRTLLLAGTPLALVGGYYLCAVIVAGRNEGKFDTGKAADVEYVGFEMFRELLFVARAEDGGMSPQYGLTYFTQLVNPIPRAIWPSKPVADAGLILAREYGALDKNGEPTMTVSPGFLGEAYLNFSFLGILIVPAAAGVLVKAWDLLLPVASRSLPAFLVYATGLATIYASGRSFNLSAFYGLLALFVLLITVERMGLIAVPNRPAHIPPLRSEIVSGQQPAMNASAQQVQVLTPEKQALSGESSHVRSRFGAAIMEAASKIGSIDGH